LTKNPDSILTRAKSKHTQTRKNQGKVVEKHHKNCHNYTRSVTYQSFCFYWQRYNGTK